MDGNDGMAIWMDGHLKIEMNEIWYEVIMA